MKPLSLRLSHLVITRLNLSDPWRRRALQVREEDVTPEERGETPATPEGAEAKETGGPSETAPDTPLEAAPEAAPEPETPEEPPAEAAPKRRRAARPKKEAEA
jgi:hypothetical protein